MRAAQAQLFRPRSRLRHSTIRHWSGTEPLSFPLGLFLLVFSSCLYVGLRYNRQDTSEALAIGMGEGRETE